MMQTNQPALACRCSADALKHRCLWKEGQLGTTVSSSPDGEGRMWKKEQLGTTAGTSPYSKGKVEDKKGGASGGAPATAEA